MAMPKWREIAGEALREEEPGERGRFSFPFFQFHLFDAFGQANPPFS